MRIQIAFLGLVLITVPVLASTIEETRAIMIRNSPDYRIGEGYGSSIEEARNTAARDLAQRIQSMIQSEQVHRTRETTTELTDTFTAKTTLVSMIQIQGLEYLDLGMVEDRYHALAYISREDLAASNLRQKDRIRGLISQAEDARLQADIGSAARDAYWAYLLSHTVLDTLQLDIAGSTNDPSYDILSYLQTLLADLHFTSQPALKEGLFQLVPIAATYERRTIQSLDISYYGGVGMDYSNISSGFGYLELHLTDPLPQKYTVNIKIEYADEGSMVHHPDIESLHGVLRERQITQARHKIHVSIPFGEEIVDEELKTPEPIPEEVDPPSHYPEGPEELTLAKPLWPMPVIILADIQDTAAFLKALETYQRNNRLQVDSNGPESLANAGLDVYLAVAGKSTVHAVLHFSDNEFVDVKRNVRITNLSEAYKGEDLYQIWIGIPHETR